MTARMKGPEGHSGLSHAGTTYEPDADGIVTIPEEAVTEAMSHGFVLATDQAAPQGSGKPSKQSKEQPAAKNSAI